MNLHSATPNLSGCPSHPLFSSPSSLRFFLCPSVHIIMFLGLLALHVVIYHGVALEYDIYLFLFFLLLITSCYTDFYSFVLCSSLISTSSLPCPCPSLHYSVWCVPVLHVVFLPCYSTGLQLPLSYCFVTDYLLIQYFISFFPLRSCECSPMSDQHTG